MAPDDPCQDNDEVTESLLPSCCLARGARREANVVLFLGKWLITRGLICDEGFWVCRLRLALHKLYIISGIKRETTFMLLTALLLVCRETKVIHLLNLDQNNNITTTVILFTVFYNDQTYR